MEIKDDWKELQDIGDQLADCFKKEKEILEEWSITTDPLKKKELEDECLELPFRELIDKYMELSNKCFYRPR